MRTIVIILLLALFTIGGELYYDAVLTNAEISPHASDPAALAIAHAAKPG